MTKITCFTVAIVFLLITACELHKVEGIDDCSSNTSFEDLEWLGDIKKNLELSMGVAGSQIIRYKYLDNTVFWIDPCYMCPDGLISVYDCDGNVICEFGGIDGRNTCMDFETEAKDSTMLWDNVQQ